MNIAPSTIVKHYSQSSICPVCETGSKGCSATEDELQLCRGEPVSKSAWKLVKAGDVFNCYRRKDDRRHLDNGFDSRFDLRFDPKPLLKPRKDWSAEAAKYAKSLTPVAREELARELGLPVAALDAFPLLGWIPDHRVNSAPGDAEPEWTAAPCWTFPQVDACGKIVGIARRFREKLSIGGGNPTNKAVMAGGLQGLFVPAGWREKPGPVFNVEGASDALALTAAGLAALGRFSNTGGGEQLAEVLKDLPADRPIVVLAENDEREKDGKTEWPGKVGAEKVAESLRSKLNRPVRIVFPPAEFKDARNWVQDMAAGAAERDSWAPIGAAILRHVERAAAAQSRFKFADSAEFLAGDYRLEYLVPRVLVKGQPAVIGGPSKTLKTSVMIDLGISMATATPFLGKFPVHRRSRVAIVSGESGEFTLKETCLRILRAKGIEPASLSGWLKWEFRLPVFTDATVMLDFAERLCALEAEVVMIDPTYLALGEVDAKSVFEMGRVLSPVAEVLLSRGITPLLAHHSNRMLPVGEVMGLEHLSHAGFAEFSRQWLLLNRREKYAGDGNHALWLSIGGSAGHGGIWALDVEEGVLDEGFTTRRWDVKLRNLNEVASTAAESREESRQVKAREKTAHEQAAVLLAIDAECTKEPAATKTKIRERTGYNPPRATEVLNALLEVDAIEEHEFEKSTGNSAKRKVVGYRRVKVASGASEQLFSGCSSDDVPRVGEEHSGTSSGVGGSIRPPTGCSDVRPPASTDSPDDVDEKARSSDVPGRKPKRKRKPVKQTAGSASA